MHKTPREQEDIPQRLDSAQVVFLRHSNKSNPRSLLNSDETLARFVNV